VPNVIEQTLGAYTGVCVCKYTLWEREGEGNTYIFIRMYIYAYMCVEIREAYAYGAPHTRDKGTTGSQLAHSSGRSDRKCCCAKAGRLPLCL